MTPFFLKVCNVSMARLATQIMRGKKLSDLGLKSKSIPYFGIKEAAFPFNMFPEVDPVLGPEMRSTGEVLGLADSFGLAYFKSQEATKLSLPIEETVLVTIANKDKSSSLEPVRLFKEMGFKILATKGTHQFLESREIESELIHKLGYGRPDIMDAIKNHEIDLIINTPSGKRSKEDSSYIRKAAIKYKILNITTTAAALAAAKGIAARRKDAGKIKWLQSYHSDIK